MFRSPNLAAEFFAGLYVWPVSDDFLLVLSGPPGSGKTTVGAQVASRFDPSVAMQSDWFWACIVNGLIPPWNVEAEQQNQAMIRASLACAARMANAGYATVLEGIFGPWHFDLLREELASVKAPIFYLVLRPSVEDCLARALDRRHDPQHAGALIAEEPIRHMYSRFQDLGTYEGHVLDSSTLTVRETADHVCSSFRSFSILD